MTTHPTANRLSDVPLWRLLVYLDEAERSVGADSQTARALATEVRRRLRDEPPDGPVDSAARLEGTGRD